MSPRPSPPPPPRHAQLRAVEVYKVFMRIAANSHSRVGFLVPMLLATCHLLACGVWLLGAREMVRTAAPPPAAEP